MIPIAAPHGGTNCVGIETRKRGRGFSVLSQRHACKLETSAPLLHLQTTEGHDAVVKIGDNKMEGELVTARKRQNEDVP
jgi:hypothetical protein